MFDENMLLTKIRIGEYFFWGAKTEESCLEAMKRD